ncbi:MAG: ATPase [Prevotella sp.]|nr:ATPase [Prevotella sp.]
MILIADSGSTKTDWSLVDKQSERVVATVKSQGINPIHQSPDTIRHILEHELITPLSFVKGPWAVDHIYFYGAGCTPAHAPKMEQMLGEILLPLAPGAMPLASNPKPLKVEVHSDLFGAARALCGNSEGIACILGTGANSGLFDGKTIVQNTPALGYILGDEGSGSVLGRLFLNAIFKNPQLAEVRDDFLSSNKLDQAAIIQKVYREPLANRFLATISLYVHEHLDNPQLHKLVVDNFRNFFKSNIAPYGRTDLPVGFVGSMAEHYPDQLNEAAAAEGYTVGAILQSPMEGLVDYHLKN